VFCANVLPPRKRHMTFKRACEDLFLVKAFANKKAAYQFLKISQKRFGVTIAQWQSVHLSIGRLRNRSTAAE